LIDQEEDYADYDLGQSRLPTLANLVKAVATVVLVVVIIVSPAIVWWLITMGIRAR
jgi:hypothetical protein